METRSKLLEMGVVNRPIVRRGRGICCQEEKRRIMYGRDDRKINAVTEGMSYPLPSIEDILHAMETCRYFLEIDLNQGFNHIEVVPEDRKKTAFVTEEFSCQFLTKHFGMETNWIAFQRAMDFTIGSLKWTLSFVLIDDVIVYSKTFDEHTEHLDVVLQRFDRCWLDYRSLKAGIHTIGSRVSRSSTKMIFQLIQTKPKQWLPFHS